MSSEIFTPSMDMNAYVVTDDVLHDLTFWEAKFQEMNFPGMDLLEATAYPISLLERVNLKKKYKRVKRDFMRFLAYNQNNDLRNAGLSEEDIFYFKKGIMPENFTVHVKIPFDYTGEVDFSNLVLMQNKPYHYEIHRFMDMQMRGMDTNVCPRKLYIPVPTGKVYIPHPKITGSGGKGKHDRSALAGFSADALSNLAKRAMPGR